jgi:hypothetical protein
MICRKYSFQKLTLFSLGNKVLDANALAFFMRFFNSVEEAILE